MIIYFHLSNISYLIWSFVVFFTIRFHIQCEDFLICSAASRINPAHSMKTLNCHNFSGRNLREIQLKHEAFTFHIYSVSFNIFQLLSFNFFTSFWKVTSKDTFPLENASNTNVLRGRWKIRPIKSTTVFEKRILPLHNDRLKFTEFPRFSDFPKKSLYVFTCIARSCKAASSLCFNFNHVISLHGIVNEPAWLVAVSVNNVNRWILNRSERKLPESESGLVRFHVPSIRSNFSCHLLVIVCSFRLSILVKPRPCSSRSCAYKPSLETLFQLCSWREVVFPRRATTLKRHGYYLGFYSNHRVERCVLRFSSARGTPRHAMPHKYTGPRNERFAGQQKSRACRTKIVARVYISISKRITNRNFRVTTSHGWQTIHAVLPAILRDERSQGMETWFDERASRNYFLSCACQLAVAPAHPPLRGPRCGNADALCQDFPRFLVQHFPQFRKRRPLPRICTISDTLHRWNYVLKLEKWTLSVATFARL